MLFACKEEIFMTVQYFKFKQGMYRTNCTQNGNDKTHSASNYDKCLGKPPVHERGYMTMHGK